MKIIRAFRDVLKFQFLEENKRQVIFYSEGKNYWNYLKGLVEGLLEQDIAVCYVSSDQEDPGLKVSHPLLNSFEIDTSHIRDWFFLNIKSGVVIMTMPDLHQYQVKRSPSNQVHYVYVQHALMSLHMAYRPGAFNHYDTIFCCGQYHVEEVRAIEKFYGLATINVVEHGYPLLDKMLADRPLEQDQSADDVNKRKNKHVLLAPSWGKQAIIEAGIAANIVERLLKAGQQVTFRPHPETAKHNKPMIDSIVSKHHSNSLFTYENSISGQGSLFDSDVLITDWSGIALEYAFGLGKPVVFIDTPRKVNNPDYQKFGIEPFEVRVRHDIGVVVDANDIVEAVDSVEIKSSSTDGIFYNVGNSDEAGAKALITLINSQPGS